MKIVPHNNNTLKKAIYNNMEDMSREHLINMMMIVIKKIETRIFLIIKKKTLNINKINLYLEKPMKSL